MGRPSVIPEVKARLEAYLNDRQADYMSQHSGERHPTIPATSDGKVNVRAIAQAIGLKGTQEKYLFEREELSSLINLMAEGLDLLPIGSRLTQAAGDKAIKARMVRQAQATKHATQVAVEAEAAQGALMVQLQDAFVHIESLKAENLRLRAQLDAVHAGIFVRVNE